MIIAGLYLTNTILSYFYIDLPILSTIGGISLLPLIFLYVSSYAFHFCEYHRVFLHYIVVNDIICWVDYSYGLPITNWELLIIQIIIAGVSLFIALYLKVKHEHSNKISN